MVRVVVSLLVLAIIVPAPARPDTQEDTFGAGIYKWLANHGKIVEHSPLYDYITPISVPLKTVADPRYDTPFKFILGRDPYANVASTPGGQVYVSEKTFDVLQYREELAGAFCHAVAHTIRHDYAAAVRRSSNASAATIGLVALTLLTNPYAIFLNPVSTMQTTQNVAVASTVVGGASQLSAAEKAERGADEMGADLCAEAGINPWGLVWLLQNYKKSEFKDRMEMLSVDPSGRIANLEAHFARSPLRFGKFDRDRAHGTPIRQPVGTPTVTPEPSGFLSHLPYQFPMIASAYSNMLIYRAHEAF
ncbi:MAG TPA: M48 family metalloprotease [Candidatus Baltobacteraceae bacterium]|nr:M48 family metalloprotease [Candidatus Baltobacteraceae bacterium]